MSGQSILILIGYSMRVVIKNGELDMQLLEYKDNKYTIPQLCKEYGISEGTFRSRLKRGLSIEQALSSNRITKIQDRPCVICGKLFKPRSDKAGKCCSSECAKQYTKQYLTKYSKDECICRYCGNKFKVMRTQLKGLYCSHECHIKQLKHDKDIRDKEKLRAKELSEAKITVRYLVKECNNTLDKWKVFDCKECGKEYFTTGKNRCFCSNECANKYNWRAHDNKKRYNKNGKPDYTITLKKLYKRDKGVCNMCGKQLNFNCD